MSVFPRRRRPVVVPSRLSVRDLLAEATSGMLQRPARSALTSLGTVLGVGTFVAILGLTSTASSQIDEHFNALTATEINVQDLAHQADPFVDLGFPGDAEARTQRLNGVRHAGVYWPVDLGTDTQVRSSPVRTGGSGGRVQVTAASSGVLAAAEPTLAQGTSFNTWHDRTRQRVAVVGTGVASQLGISTLETRPALFIGDEAFTVIGILDAVERKPELLLSVIVPRSTAQEVWGPPKNSASMLISTRLGAAPQVATEVATALDPAHADYFKVMPPPDPKTLRGEVGGDLDQLFLLLAAICLFIGTIGIANTTLVAVLERTGEIGLRRALGARGRHVTSQFLAESGALGALGGLVGTSLGTVTVVVVALAREWTPVLSPTVVVTAPAIGLAAGLLAGLYPAWRASRIQPVEALRR
ncbi:putative ABC transport system permease protein [Streptomyces sp. KhCrAH-43]|uniref:ABC transporter permease n=1 Tax=unclassified Streptomyces TaxID=2593676 RepID=UPI00037CE6BC|nr:ABC transporter permease [Streptomyces sp. KhCrAH-43]MYS34952.1 FtsX-like permease family protein [Streptomyces sp. SID4920]MYX65271.1 FtsX-like permease family protein [Streptomyces sp. SID8373]RAJ64759.1 putative ABC transport system permease protein [Streptomyces sp. KhCrAH-43]